MVTIGGKVIDGTVASRLEQARRAVFGQQQRPHTARTAGRREAGHHDGLTIRPEDPGCDRAGTSRRTRRPPPEEVGRVEIGDGIARVEGLHSAMTNELLEFEGLLGVALNLDVREMWCSSATARISKRAYGAPKFSIPVDDAFLGRGDPLGNPIDGLSAIEAEDRRALEVQAPTVVQRQPVKEPMLTGIERSTR